MTPRERYMIRQRNRLVYELLGFGLWRRDLRRLRRLQAMIPLVAPPRMSPKAEQALAICVKYIQRQAEDRVNQ